MGHGNDAVGQHQPLAELEMDTDFGGVETSVLH
jgi:hypothetical protein